FYLVRHGKRVCEQGDPPLSAAGIIEAHATAAWLHAQPLCAVYSSPLRRALETAAHIATQHDLPVQTDARLRERANWGDVPAQAFADFAALWERGTRERDFVPPVGDSARGAGARVESLVVEVARAHPHGEVAAVLHGGVLTDFLVNVYPESELNRWHPQFVAMQSELVTECSITIVEYDGRVYRLIVFAQTKHLIA
ncbi:MAG: histidine phosphatase family protein, partial [Chloroflexi bacterium]|nr:histidine phosphatase family protein [Chloroflexota bacterium]